MYRLPVTSLHKSVRRYQIFHTSLARQEQEEIVPASAEPEFLVFFPSTPCSLLCVLTSKEEVGGTSRVGTKLLAGWLGVERHGLRSASSARYKVQIDLYVSVFVFVRLTRDGGWSLCEALCGSYIDDQNVKYSASC